MKYLVAVDGSPNGDAAFWTALHLIRNPSQDLLYILHAVEHVQAASMCAFIPPVVRDKMQEQVNEEGRKMLSKYCAFAKSMHIQVHPILAISNKVSRSRLYLFTSTAWGGYL